MTKMSRACQHWLSCYSGEARSGEEESPSDSGDSVEAGGGDDGGDAGGEGSLRSNNLNLVSGASAVLSLVIVAVAVSTGHWLLTDEKLPKLGRQADNANTESPVKHTYSGLWRVCVSLDSNTVYECSNIDYFPKEEYSPDPSDSTMAIPYAVTKSAVFFLSATLLLVLAEVCYFAGHLARPRPGLLVFIAGLIWIVSGLLMLVGMVMYISVFKAEVGSKLRPRSSFQGPPFIYRYGYSFLLYVSGFITTEFAGTSAIFLHISWQQLEFGRECSKRKYPNRDTYHLDSQHLHLAQHGNIVYGGYHLCERHRKRYLYDAETADHYQHHQHTDCDEYLPSPSLECNHFPGMTHDFTTETVSTIADVLQEEFNLGVQREYVTYDYSENLPPLPETVRNSGWKSNSFKRTTPV